MRWAGTVARMEVKRSTYEVLIGICEGKRPLDIDETNIKADFKETGLGMWSGFILLRIGNSCGLL
jgi:hypothetical protein